MSNKHWALILLILISVTPLAGCWSSQEIESGGFVTLMALDRTADGQVELTFSLAITESLVGGGGGGGGGSDVPAWTVSSTGKNLSEAIAKAREFTGRRPVWSHAQALIIGEDLAREGIAPVLDFLLRTRSFRLNTRTLVSEGKAKDLLKLDSKITKLPGRYVRDLLDVADENSVAPTQSLLDVMSKLVGKTGDELYLPLIRARPVEKVESKSGEDAGKTSGGTGQDGAAGGEQQKPEALVLSGSAVFLGDKMVGKLSDLETRGMLWLRGDTARASVVVDMPGGYVVERQIFARRTLKISQANGQLSAKIAVYQDGDVLEHNLPQLELNAAALKDLDAALTATIQSQVNAALSKLQKEYKTDTLGLGSRFYHLYPKLFRSLNWPEAFASLPIEVEVHANFRRTGEAGQSPLVR